MGVGSDIEVRVSQTLAGIFWYKKAASIGETAWLELVTRLFVADDFGQNEVHGTSVTILESVSVRTDLSKFTGAGVE